MGKIDLQQLRRIGLALSTAAAAAWVFTRFTDALPLSEWFLPRLLFALFWAWLWGVWGMLLSIPIIVIVKVVSEHVEQLESLAELLGE